MANTNDNTPHDRANEKNKPILEPLSLMPSMGTEYLLKPESGWGDLLTDSSSLLGSGIEVLRALADDVDTELAYGALYLMEAAHTTLCDGHALALKEDSISGNPDDFERGMDLIVSFIESGNTEKAIRMTECMKRDILQSLDKASNQEASL
ncbi:MAG: hypothetical protein JKY88_06695 [Pseudomonadales bacterium]|nr:hypothetical protein [Pseudomonadales bacterium]